MPDENQPKKIQMSSTYGQFAGKNPFSNENKDSHEELAKEMIEEIHKPKIPNVETLAALQEARELAFVRLAMEKEEFAKLQHKAEEAKK